MRPKHRAQDREHDAHACEEDPKDDDEQRETTAPLVAAYEGDACEHIEHPEDEAAAGIRRADEIAHLIQRMEHIRRADKREEQRDDAERNGRIARNRP